ncbi:MAG: protease complex subunit PrcB family protein [Methanocellales archaeon]|nr:protease complex subunit PrcB family protein [Methanocellales archaeon]MDD3291098.1 protease complex subunit PrcB family protein [Methanocellales archaeon]MDD5234983.1 protease complex subunit PrcB family protein [Methanocellales archaeon]MDD5484646.1 protease complex subunit PrcB family protein [Methanocellales archaeon]
MKSGIKFERERNMKRVIIPLVLISMLLVSGCVTQLSGQELTFETISKGSSSDHDERKDYVIRDLSEWGTLWGKVHSRVSLTPPLPNVNFEDEMVIAVFQGSHPTGGYAIEITQIVEKESSIEVFVKETSPSPDSVVTQAFTQPYHIVKTKRVDKDVIFIR